MISESGYFSVNQLKLLRNNLDRPEQLFWTEQLLGLSPKEGYKIKSSKQIIQWLSILLNKQI